jgi:hypothetical protein
MHSIIRNLRRNVVAYLALFLALTGTSAYAADTVFSTDIVDGEVKAPDLATAAVTDAKLASNAVRSGKVVDDSLTGADIDESSLALTSPDTATVESRSVTAPLAGGGEQVVLEVPDFGQVMVENCSLKSARSSFFNNTAGKVNVYTDASHVVGMSTDPQFSKLAPGGKAMGTEVEGADRAIYQASVGTGRVATIVVMARPTKFFCHFQAQALID